MTRNEGRSSSLVPGKSRDGIAAYARLASIIWSKISTGEWPIGTRLPTVAQLSDAYGVAPVTVRQAFQILSAQGLIHARQGRGTFVIASTMSKEEGEAPSFGKAYFESWIVGPEEEVEVLDRLDDVSVPSDLVGEAELFPRYIYLKRLHLSKGVPVCLIDFYIAREAYDSLPEGVDDKFKIGLLLMAHARPRPKFGRQVTTVGLSDADVSEKLKIVIGSPVVRVARRFTDVRGRIVGAALHVYRGEMFRQEINQSVDKILKDVSGWLPSQRAVNPREPVQGSDATKRGGGRVEESKRARPQRK